MRLGRFAVAAVWLYHGLWAKVLAARPDHLEVLASLPALFPEGAQRVMLVIGLAEVVLAGWVLAGWRPVLAASGQSLALLVMNAGGLIWASETIASPGEMITSNAAFLTLVWMVALSTDNTARSIRVDSPWQRGRLDGREGPPQLLFGAMHEDHRIERQVFKPGGRILCIGSAGDTALVLAAAGFEVVAVDINPAQVQLLQHRLRTGVTRPGVIDHRMAHARRLFALLGLKTSDLQSFLELDQPAQQVHRWRMLQTRRGQWLTRLALHPVILRRIYGPSFAASLPDDFVQCMGERLARGFATHPNRTNQWAWQLLLGTPLPAERPSPNRIRVLCVDAASHLRSCAPNSFDGFSLSNVLDGTPPTYESELMAAVRHAARPGARVVLRSLREPVETLEAAWARADRAMIWGSIRVQTVDGQCLAVEGIQEPVPRHRCCGASTVERKGAGHVA